jgi:hypothetical protein
VRSGSRIRVGDRLSMSIMASPESCALSGPCFSAGKDLEESCAGIENKPPWTQATGERKNILKEISNLGLANTINM